MTASNGDVLLILQSGEEFWVRNLLFCQDSDLLQTMTGDWEDSEPEEIVLNEVEASKTELDALLSFYETELLAFPFKFQKHLQSFEEDMIDRILRLADYFGLQAFQRSLLLVVKRQFFEKAVFIQENSIEFEEERKFYEAEFGEWQRKRVNQILSDLGEGSGDEVKATGPEC